jgi:hypothetical protein
MPATTTRASDYIRIATPTETEIEHRTVTSAQRMKCWNRAAKERLLVALLRVLSQWESEALRHA